MKISGVCNFVRARSLLPLLLTEITECRNTTVGKCYAFLHVTLRDLWWKLHNQLWSSKETQFEQTFIRIPLRAVKSFYLIYFKNIHSLQLLLVWGCMYYALVTKNCADLKINVLFCSSAFTVIFSPQHIILKYIKVRTQKRSRKRSILFTWFSASANVAEKLPLQLLSVPCAWVL